MPAKSTSPEAAQRKLWRIEIRDLEKAANKVRRDCRKDFNASLAKSKAAQKAALAAHTSHLKLAEKLVKTEARHLVQINDRLATLRGRL